MLHDVSLNVFNLYNQLWKNLALCSSGAHLTPLESLPKMGKKRVPENKIIPGTNFLKKSLIIFIGWDDIPLEHIYITI